MLRSIPILAFILWPRLQFITYLVAQMVYLLKQELIVIFVTREDIFDKYQILHLPSKLQLFFNASK